MKIIYFQCINFVECVLWCVWYKSCSYNIYKRYNKCFSFLHVLMCFCVDVVGALVTFITHDFSSLCSQFNYAFHGMWCYYNKTELPKWLMIITRISISLIVSNNGLYAWSTFMADMTRANKHIYALGRLHSVRLYYTLIGSVSVKYRDIA